MWSFSSLFPSPGLSELNGSSSITKAQGQLLLHKLPIQLTVCKCSTGRLREGQPFWQVSFLIYQTVKPSHSGAHGHCVCLLMLNCDAEGAILVVWQGAILKTDFKIKCTVVLIILTINDVLITNIEWEYSMRIQHYTFPLYQAYTATCVQHHFILYCVAAFRWEVCQY